MHSQLALKEHASLNLAPLILLDPVVHVCRLYLTLYLTKYVAWHCRFLGVQKVPIQSNHIGKYSMKSALIWCFELISWPRVSKDMTTLG